MPLLTLCFQLHQPFRLHPDGTSLFWDEKNREIFTQKAERCYLPAIQMFSDLVRAHYDFKICLSPSGTFLEQAELYQPQILDALKGLLHLGGDTRQVEFLEQPYYYSYASFFADPRKTEFKEQVSLHRQKMHDILGAKPTAFVNTGLSYNNEVANIVADMGFKATAHFICLADEMGGGLVHGSLFLQLLAVDGNAFAHVNEQILKIGGLLGLAAHSPYCASFILCRFLALKTKHITTSFVFFYSIARLKI